MPEKQAVLAQIQSHATRGAVARTIRAALLRLIAERAARATAMQLQSVASLLLQDTPTVRLMSVAGKISICLRTETSALSTNGRQLIRILWRHLGILW